MSRGLSRGSFSTTLHSPRVRVPRLVVQLVVGNFHYAARPGALTRRAARCAARRQLLRLVQARRRLLRLRCASGCLGTSRGSSRDSSSTTPPRTGSSSTTSTTTRVRLLLHVARRVAWLVVDYFVSAARPGASAHRAARCRLLLLRRASDCFGMSRGSSHGSLLTTLHSPCVRVPRLVVRLVVDYFDYAAHSGAATCRAVHCAARRRLLHLVQARRRLLNLRRASWCLDTSCGSSRGSSSTTSPRAGSSSTTSPTPCVRVPRHVARLVKRFVVE
jgi:hypothetical protein